MDSQSQPSESRGRPRSQTAHRAVLSATCGLLDEVEPSQVTMEAIARRAGVSKRTLYRWWPTRTDVMLEAILERVEPHGGYVDTGDLTADLTRQVRSVTRLISQTVVGDALRVLIADAQSGPSAAAAFRERYLIPRRTIAATMLETARTRGQLRHDIDIDTAVDMLYAPIYFRLLTGHAGLDDGFADTLVGSCLHGLAPSQSSP